MPFLAMLMAMFFPRPRLPPVTSTILLLFAIWRGVLYPNRPVSRKVQQAKIKNPAAGRVLIFSYSPPILFSMALFRIALLRIALLIAFLATALLNAFLTTAFLTARLTTAFLTARFTSAFFTAFLA